MLFSQPNLSMLTPEDRAQAGYAGLLSLAQGLIAGGAPSAQPGGVGRGLAEGVGGFGKAYQSTANNMLAQKLTGMQLAQMQEKAARDKQWTESMKALLAVPPAGVPGTQEASAPGAPSSAAPAARQLTSPFTQSALGNPVLQQALMDPEKGPALASKLFIGEGTPSNVREWEYFSKLPPKEQEAYLTMKRNNQWLNMGGSMMLPSQTNPAGGPQANVLKTITPDEDPALKGQQAEQSVLGKGRGDAVVTANKKATDATRTIDMLDGIEGLIDRSTGSALGTLRDQAGNVVGHSTEGSRAIAELRVVQAALMTSMPRMEGPQSDRDAQLYQQAAGQIGDPMVPTETRKAAVKMIRALQEKYKVPATSGGGSGGSAPPRVLRFDAMGNPVP
jgi:hypothetical protein